LLGAIDDHDPVRSRVDSAQASQAIGERLAKLALARGRTVVQVAQTGAPCSATKQATPQGMWKIREGGTSKAKVVGKARWAQFRMHRTTECVAQHTFTGGGKARLGAVRNALLL
jgi:hypothetical protein